MLVSLITKEFRLLGRNKAELFGPFCFLLALISLTSVMLSDGDQIHIIFTSIICLYFVVILSSNEVFERDYHDGSLEQLSRFDPFFYKIFAAKLLFKIILNFIAALAIAPIIAIFSKIQGDLLWKFVILLLAATPFLTIIAVFSSVISLGVYKNSIISIIINFPLSCAMLLLISSESSNLLKDPLYGLGVGLQVIAALSLILMPFIFILVSFVFRNLINRLDSSNSACKWGKKIV